MTGRFLVRGVTGGKGQGSRKVQRDRANLWVCLGAKEGGRRDSSAVKQITAAGVSSGEGIPVREQR